MRFIPTRVHGLLDYATVPLALLAPRLFGFRENKRASSIPLVVGTSALLYSLLTDYELGAVRKLPMQSHLWLDAMGGLFTLASPWLLGFSKETRMPHVSLGLFEVGAAALTQTTPRG